MATGPCPVCGFDGARLGPRDAAAALRSFPRRFRIVLKLPEDEERPDDVLHRRPRGGGLSAIEHAAWAATGIADAGESLRLVLIRDRPTVRVPEVGPPGDVVAGGDLPLEAVLARLESAVNAVADLVDRTHGAEWKRSGMTESGSVITALELLSVAVHFGAHHIRAADRTINEVAGELPG
jgi:hypothetical protein